MRNHIGYIYYIFPQHVFSNEPLMILHEQTQIHTGCIDMILPQYESLNVFLNRLHKQT